MGPMEVEDSKQDKQQDVAEEQPSGGSKEVEKSSDESPKSPEPPKVLESSPEPPKALEKSESQKEKPETKSAGPIFFKDLKESEIKPTASKKSKAVKFAAPKRTKKKEDVPDFIKRMRSKMGNPSDRKQKSKSDAPVSILKNKKEEKKSEGGEPEFLRRLKQ